MTVESGLDVLCKDRLDLLRGRRVGVLCHPASVASDLTHVVDRLIEAASGRRGSTVPSTACAARRRT